jgi:hypothetical protein
LDNPSIANNVSVNPTSNTIPNGAMTEELYAMYANSDGSLVTCGMINSSNIYISYYKTTFVQYTPVIYPNFGIPYVSDINNGYATIFYQNSPTGLNAIEYVGNINISSQTIEWKNVTSSVVQSTNESYFNFPTISTGGNNLVIGNNTAVSYSINASETWTTINYPTALTQTLSSLISADGSTFTIFSNYHYFIWGTTGAIG